tara:strand:+ start:963 stop:1595 length:633 start_codon:yes stop_codon:yes gene_type:complete
MVQKRKRRNKMTFTINDGSLQEKCLLCSKPLLGKRRKFCSKNCGDKVSNAGRHLRVTKQAKPRLKNCEICEKELEGMQRVFCSPKCYGISKNTFNRNPLSLYGTGKSKKETEAFARAWTSCAYDESHLPQSVELYIANLPDKPFTEEDQRYLNSCLEEMGPAIMDEKTYVSPNYKAKQDGVYSDHGHHSAYISESARLRAYERRMSRKDY